MQDSNGGSFWEALMVLLMAGQMGIEGPEFDIGKGMKGGSGLTGPVDGLIGSGVYGRAGL